MKLRRARKFCENNTLARILEFTVLEHLLYKGSHRLEKYLNIQDCLEKSLKIKFALKST